MKVLGQLPHKVPVKFRGVASTFFTQPVVLEGLAMEMNLSGPTLKEWGISQHHRDDCLEINGTRVKLMAPIVKNKHCEVAAFVKESVTVCPGRSETVLLNVPAFAARGLSVGQGILEGSQVFEESTNANTFRCALLKGSDDGTLVAGVLNTSDVPITIPKGIRYGTFFPRQAEEKIYSIGAVRREAAAANETSLPEFMRGPTTTDNRRERTNHLLQHFKLSTNSFLEDLEAKAAAIALLLKHFQLFAWDHSFGRTSTTHHKIQLKPGAVPFKARYRMLNPEMEKKLDEQLDKWLDCGVIEPCTSPWSAPLVPVRKKSTPNEPTRYRWAVDYRRLNEQTVVDASHIGDCFANLTRLQGSRVFSTLDASGAFHQIPLAEESKDLTAFSTHRGQYRFSMVPFGIVNGPAAYARLVHLVLSGVATGRVLPYLDDVLIHSPDLESHMEALDQVLEAHARHGLRLNPDKCSFFQRSVTYLGHVVSEEGTAPVPEYLEVVKTWPRPTNKSELRAFLGKVSYYRRFVKDFARVAAPLYDELSDKVNKGKCGNVNDKTPQFIKAFETLKQALCEAPILAHPRFNDPEAKWILDTDWSQENNACGVVLSQIQDGVERPIAYHGVKLSSAQANYAPTKGELAAIIIGLKKFRYFIADSHVTIRTDHRALEQIKTMEAPERIIMRWLEILADFDFHTEYRKGSMHGNADGLSRRPNLPELDYNLDDQQFPPSICTLHGQETFQIADLKELKTAQNADGELMAPKTTNNAWRKFTLLEKQGITYARVESRDRVALPYSLLAKASRAAHLLMAHKGVAATLSTLEQVAVSPYLREAVVKTVSECLECQLKTTPTRQHALYVPKTAEGPFQTWSLDFVGPLPPSGTQGARYVLTMVDVFTKWPEAFPCKAATAETVLKHLTQDIFPRFGLPGTLHSDRGTHFIASQVQSVANQLGIQWTTTPAYHPQSNPVERFNQDLGKGINALAGTDQRRWAERIPAILQAARAAPHRGTKMSPYEAVFGRPPQVGRTLLPGVPIEPEGSRNLEQVDERLRRNLQEYHLSQARYYKGKIKHFPVGTWVSLFSPVIPAGASSKFKTNYWSHPWKITERISDVVYRIESTNQTSHLPSPQVVSYDRLRRYRDGQPQDTAPAPETGGKKTRDSERPGKKRPADHGSEEEEEYESWNPSRSYLVAPGAAAGPVGPAGAASTTPLATPPGPSLPPKGGPPAVPYRDRAPRKVQQPPAWSPKFRPTRTSTEQEEEGGAKRKPNQKKSRNEKEKERLDNEKERIKRRREKQKSERDERHRNRSDEYPKRVERAPSPEVEPLKRTYFGEMEEPERAESRGELTESQLEFSGLEDISVSEEPTEEKGNCYNQ